MCSLISGFVVRCLDSIISPVSIAEISRVELTSVAAQAGLCLAGSETPDDTFCRVVAIIYVCDLSLLPKMALRIPTLLLEVLVVAENIIVSLPQYCMDHGNTAKFIAIQLYILVNINLAWRYKNKIVLMTNDLSIQKVVYI